MSKNIEDKLNTPGLQQFTMLPLYEVTRPHIISFVHMFTGQNDIMRTYVMPTALGAPQRLAELSAKQALPETLLCDPKIATAVLAVAAHEPACKLDFVGGVD